MNTHILIPIKDIIERINHLQGLGLLAEQEKDFNGQEMIMIEIATINEIVNKGKQISLDEKDIEEKALKQYPINMYKPLHAGLQDINEIPRRRFTEDLKQVLKDLL